MFNLIINRKNILKIMDNKKFRISMKNDSTEIKI